MSRVLVAAIGNAFCGDDAFGSAVVRALARHPLPDNVRVADYGLRSYDLAYALTDEYETIILVDAAPRGGAPGTVFLLEPTLGSLPPPGSTLADPHRITLLQVLRTAQALGGIRGRVYLVGCEPAVLEPAESEADLSRPVRQAIPRALNLIETLLRHPHPPAQTASSQAPLQLQETP